MSKIREFGVRLGELFREGYVDNSDGCAPARRAMLWNGYLTTIVNAMTTGTYMTVLLLAMGAEDVYLGYVSMATSLCALLQLVSPLFWERLQHRKILLMASSVFSTVINYGLITAIPFFPTSVENKLIWYMVASVAAAVCSNFCSPASGAWTMQSIPFSKRVSYSTLSVIPTNVLQVVFAFLCGRLLDRNIASGFALGEMSPELTTVLLLRVVSVIPVVVGVILTGVYVKEYPYEQTGKRVSFRSLVAPVSDKPFMCCIILSLGYSFASSVIGNYFSVHLIDNVKMPYTMISSAGIISLPLILIFTPVWSVFLKNHSWFKIFGIATLGYCLAWLCNVFITDKTIFMYFAAILVGHVFVAGITQVTGNILYYKMPDANRTAYLSCYSLLSTLAAFLGSTVGTLFVKYSRGLSFDVFGLPVGNLQLTSALAVALVVPVALYSLFFAEKIIRRSEEQKTPTQSE